MSQSDQPNPPSGHGSRGLAIISLALVAILSLGLAGYTSLNPHNVTVTQQQVVTNTESVFNTQTFTSVSTVTSVTTATSTATSTANGFVNNGGMIYQNCGYNGCYYQAPSYASISDICKSTGQNDTVQCSGYLYQPSSACPELAIPYINPIFMESQGYLYVTLYNLPSNHPSSGAYVTVTGQLSQGYAPGPYGQQACTDNAITVTSIS